MRRFLVILLIILLSAANTLGDEFEDLLNKAQMGDVSAQAALGSLYHHGKGVAQNLDLAKFWWEKAAEQGHTVAQFNLGLMYYKGQGVRQNFEQSVYWWHEAAVRGHAVSQFNLGLMFLNGKGTAQSHQLAYVWTSLAAAQGFDSAIKNREFTAAKLTPDQLNAAKALITKIQHQIDQGKFDQIL
jgi:TPR repeat protein